jgi:hypothetical protein
MKQKFTRFVTYLQAFLLGGYFVSEFQFHKPIEPHRWVLTSIFFILFLAMANQNSENE